MMLAKQRVLDGLAIGASGLCLIHCLALPVIFLMIPALATYIAVPEAFHLGALLFAVPTSVVAMTAGYRRHCWPLPVLLAMPGMVLLGFGALVAPGPTSETLATVAGSTLLATGHVLNWRALTGRRVHATAR